MFYVFDNVLYKAVFVKRLNRFTAQVKLNDNPDCLVLCHVPNSGRMRELLTAGAEIMLKPAFSEARKTSFDLYLVKYNGNWVSIDSRLPNKLIEKAVSEGYIPALEGALLNRREPKYRSGRFDLEYIMRDHSKVLVECKSVTLVEEGVALFPDAPTSRGKRHLDELIEAMNEGYLASVILLVQRDDARIFSPNWAMDQAFSNSLVRFNDKGGQVLSNYINIYPEGITWGGELPVKLDGFDGLGLKDSICQGGDRE